jgi:hypothetical protein
MAKPSSVDANLNNLNELWKKNPENLRRSPDIVQTIKNVLKTLPREVNGVTVDPDKIKLMTYLSLYTREMTEWMIDVYITAENGDYNGLALVNQMWNNVVDMFNWGDLLAKTYCTETGEIKDPEAELNDEGSIIGSPLALLAWGLRKYSDWPVRALPEEYKKPQKINHDVLMVYGNKESAKWIEKDYLPFFKNGHLVNFENLGHMDVSTAEADAYRYMEKMFFLKGVTDISKFKHAVVK